MRSVIIIAYGFPPEGNAGVYRPLRFVRHLPTLGWRARVVTRDTDSYERYDPGLVSLVPRETDVVRVREHDLWQTLQTRRARRIQKKLANASVGTGAPSRAAYNVPIRSSIRALLRTVEAWCYHPDMAMSWIRPAVEATVQICDSKPPSAILATAMPWSSFIVAQQASQRTGVPYVLDFRDSWTVTYNEFEARRPTWAQRWDRRTLSELFQGAQAVIFRYVTEAECYWRAYQGALEVSRIHIIPNGYEGTIDKYTTPNGDKFTILYTGTLSSYRYDTLLQSLHELQKLDPAHAQQLRLLFVGEGMDSLEADAAALGLSNMVMTTGSTLHAEVTRLQRQAHALLLLGRPPSMRGYELFASAKLFEYLKAGKPIFGILPPDEAKKILHGVGVSTVAEADSPAEIITVLRQLLDAWSAKTLSSLVPDQTACEAYSAERQTKTLVRALEGMPPTHQFVPGAVEIPPSLWGTIHDRGGMRHGHRS